ncbi:hypothetical protein P5704_024475 (plasmid) [Pseudomonas sp. FeN3W]|nr:hypothetical protein P5704_024475 [Pseudomonas sp. FeN3W]
MKFYKYLNLRVANMVCDNLSLRTTEAIDLNDEYELFPDEKNDTEIIEILSCQINDIVKNNDLKGFSTFPALYAIRMDGDSLIELCKKTGVPLNSKTVAKLKLENESFVRKMKSNEFVSYDRLVSIWNCLVRGITLEQLIGDKRRDFVRAYSSSLYLVLSGTINKSSERHFIREGYCKEKAISQDEEYDQYGVVLKLDLNENRLAEKGITARRIKYLSGVGQTQYSSSLSPYSKLKERLFYKISEGPNSWRENMLTKWYKENEIRLLFELNSQSLVERSSGGIKVFPLIELIDFQAYSQSQFQKNLIKFSQVYGGSKRSSDNARLVVNKLNTKVGARGNAKIGDFNHTGDRFFISSERTYSKNISKYNYLAPFIFQIWTSNPGSWAFNETGDSIEFECFHESLRYGKYINEHYSISFSKHDLMEIIDYLENVENDSVYYYSYVEAGKINMFMDKVAEIKPLWFANHNKFDFGIHLTLAGGGDIYSYDFLCEYDLSVILKFENKLCLHRLPDILAKIYESGRFSDIHYKFCREMIHKNLLNYVDISGISKDKEFTSKINLAVCEKLAEGNVRSFYYNKKIFVLPNVSYEIVFTPTKEILEYLSKTAVRTDLNSSIVDRLPLLNRLFDLNNSLDI